jgi:hypothetical protein
MQRFRGPLSFLINLKSDCIFSFFFFLLLLLVLPLILFSMRALLTLSGLARFASKWPGYGQATLPPGGLRRAHRSGLRRRAPAGERPTAAREESVKKRIEAPTHTRARMRSGASLHSRELTHTRQWRSACINHRAFASTKANKAPGRFSNGLTCRKKSFSSCFPFGRGTHPASLLEAGASLRHAQHDPKHPNLPAFSAIARCSMDGVDLSTAKMPYKTTKPLHMQKFSRAKYITTNTNKPALKLSSEAV